MPPNRQPGAARGPPPHAHSRHHDILEDPDVMRWYRGMQARSRPAAQVYRNHLARFCKAVGVAPRDLLDLPEKQMADVLQDFTLDESARGLRGTYLVKYVTAVRRWLRHNGKTLVRRIDVPRQPGEETEIRIPTPQEFRRVRDRLEPRNRIRHEIIALSGQRPEVMGTHGGRDGLTLGDIPDLDVRDGRIEWLRVPAQVKVRSEISKNRKPYFFFLAPSTCELIAAELRYRVGRGESLGPSSPLVASKYRAHKGHLHTGSLVRPVKLAMEREGVHTPPYAWRSYFSHHWMRYARSGDYGEFFMGHSGGIAAIYRLRKQLPPESIEDMRAAFEDALAGLTGEEGRRATPYAEVAATLLRLWGLTEEQVEEYKLADLSNEELTQLLQRQMATSAAPAPQTQAPQTQRIIGARDLPDALAHGWLVKMQLSDGSIVVEST